MKKKKATKKARQTKPKKSKPTHVFGKLNVRGIRIKGDGAVCDGGER